MKPEDVPEELLSLYGRNYLGATPKVAARRAMAAVLAAHERQVRERVAAESAVLAPADLAALLNYVVGREGIRVVDEATLDRAFAALKATQPAEAVRGES